MYVDADEVQDEDEVRQDCDHEHCVEDDVIRQIRDDDVPLKARVHQLLLHEKLRQAQGSRKRQGGGAGRDDPHGRLLQSLR